MWSGIGYNFVNNSSTIYPHNHGTHVAGTVAAVTNNGTGVAGVAGGSGSGDGVRLMSCQVFTNTSNGGFHVAPVYAADNGASISQNSWGYTHAGVYNTPVLDAIDYFNLNGGGISLSGGITIFAAGNANSSGQWYPACYSGTFSVAATNNQDKKAWYSNYDTWIDVSAPGGETSFTSARGVLSTLINNTYGYYQGTSMACPHVSGVAGLLISYALRNGIILSNIDISEILRTTTDDHYNVNPTFNGKLGTGRVNAETALIEVQDMLSGVMNPMHFNAQIAGPNQINLSWQKNNNNNDVILAWSYEDNIDDLINGTSYEVGQTLAGGGIVLFKGSSISFEHLNLMEATKYYYRLWSFNELNEYSAGRHISATTECEYYAELPFLEDFNASTELPDCWEIVDHIGNGQVWKFGSGGYLIYTTGNYAYLNSYTYGTGNSQNADLITPTFDLSGYIEVHLKFKHYFRSYSSSAGRLSYSIDNGQTWVLIQTWSGSSTSNPETFNMALPAVDGKSQVKFKFNYTGTSAYYWSVDDVEVVGSLTNPSSYFAAEPTDALVGETITFSELVGGSSYSIWEWDFGDGADPPTATGQGPHEVVYYTNGTKTVSLTLDGVYSEVKSDYVSVNEQAIVYNENFEPVPAYSTVPAGWDIMRNTAADGGLNGNNLVPAATDAWFINTITSGLNPPAEFVKNGEASLAIDYTAPDFTWAISPEIQIPDDFQVSLTFWLWYAFDNGSGPKPTNFHISLFTDNNWTILTSWEEAGNNMYEELIEIDITQFAGKTARFGFIYEYTNGYPVAIDDIVVTSEAPPFWVWLGTQGNNWTDPYNWTKGVPSDTSDIVILISDFYPIIDEAYNVKDLTITTEATLKIAPGGQLTVSGQLTNNSGPGGLVLEANSSLPGSTMPDASLIHSGAGVEAIVERYISGNPMAWHQLSSPVVSQAIAGQTPGNFNEGSIFTWFEPAQSWVNYNNTIVWPTWQDVNGSNNFVEGRGYLTAYSGNPIKEFYGELNQGEMSINLSHLAHPDDNPGFNLIGNPYPSSIDWKAESGWNRNNLATSGSPDGYSIWIWNPEQGQYGTYHSSSLDDAGTNGVTRYIAPMQAFWVKAKENGVLTMNNMVRTHSSQHWLKNTEQVPPILSLIVSTSANHYRDQVKLEFGHQTSNGGAEKFSSMHPTAPGLYAVKDGKKYSISFLDNLNSNQQVAVGFKPGVQALHTIEASGTGLFNNILLEDLQTGLMHDLSANPVYSFFANTGDDINRFIIHFKQEAIGFGNAPESSNSTFYVHGNMLFILTQNSTSLADIYDLQGRLITRSILSHAGQHQIQLSLPTGIYLLQTISDNKVSTGKFLIK